MSSTTNPVPAYDHAKYELRRNLLRWMLDKIAFKLLAKIDRVEGLENIPQRGAGIVVINHIAFIDSMVAMTVMPRNVVPLAKIEVFKYPVWGIFPWIWNVIPVDRERMDREAIRRSLQVLAAGEVLLMAPEGTRSPSMQQAKEGLAYLGYKGNAALIPMAIDGTPGYPSLSPRPRHQGGAVIKIGKALRYRDLGPRPGRDQLRLMTDEVMYQIAALLPESRRGVYTDLSRASMETIEHLPPEA